MSGDRAGTGSLWDEAGEGRGARRPAGRRGGAGGGGGRAGRPPGRRVRVLLTLPLEPAGGGTYDYWLPDALHPPLDEDAAAAVPVGLGAIVVVPFGPHLRYGVIWDPPAPAETGAEGEDDATEAEATPTPPPIPEHRLKEVAEICPVPPMTASLRRLVEWVAAYTLSPPGVVLRMALSVPAALAPPAAQSGWRAVLPPPLGARMTAARKKVLDLLPPGVAVAGAELARAAGVGTGVVRGLADAGLIEPVLLPAPAAFVRPDPDHPAPALTPDQAAAADELCSAVRAHTFGVTLLDGVTGSGKTEVYLAAIAEALRQGRQALVLLPEIALSAQWLSRFERRFGVAPALWHSELGSTRRRLTWRAVAAGQAPVVVGARSALFLPFPDLGLVVVDEEHETAFKQEDGVVYHARDMAVVRARLSGAPAVLVSATPSLESLTNAGTGRYRRLHLPERHGAAGMPQVAAIDLRAEPPPRGRFLAPPLAAAVTETLARGEQAMLFLNRRGYAPLTLCRACGHRMQCPHCSAWLVEHRAHGRLQCHHCGHTVPSPRECPACKAEHSLTPVGPGVERLSEEAAALWPEARRAVMASDTLPGPSAAAELAHAIEAREVDLVIGTQIVAKGWHFPHLTLVGVVDADLGLGGGDLRAAERTVQLLHQVAGRAGRADHPGRVLLQTWMPEHPVMRALVSGDYMAFMAAEAAQRRPGHWPPFGRLAALIVSGPDEAEADRAARALGQAAPRGEGVEVLGPAPAPLALLRGRHRRRLLLRCRREQALQPLLRAWLGRVELPRSVRLQVDVDPVSFL